MSIVQWPHATMGRFFRLFRRNGEAGRGPRPESDLGALIKLAVPSMVATTAGTAMSFVDFAFVSQLGSEAQAAVGNGAVLVWTFFSLGMGLASVVSTFAAQALGQGKPRDGAAYLWQAIYLSGGFALVGLALIPLMPRIFHALGHPAQVVELESVYTRILLLSAGPTIAAAAISNYFNGIHRPAVTMVSMIAANLFNVLADYVLIFGHWGFPALGVAGAGLATLIALTGRLAWLLLAMSRPAFRREFDPFGYWRYGASPMRGLVRLGLPVGLQWVADVGTWALFANWLIGKFGTVDLAATHITWKLLELSWMPAIGIGVGINAVVGKAIGQGDPELASRRARLGARLTIAYMGLMGAVFAIFRYPLIDAFTDDPAVLSLGVNLMLLAAAFQVFDAMSIAYGSALRGAGDTKWPAVILASYCYGIVILGGWIWTVLWEASGSYGPWIMCTVYAILLSFTLRYRWVRGGWRRIDIFAGGPGRPAAPAEANPTTPGDGNGRDARLQENGSDPQDGLSDEGQPGSARAGLAETLERDGPVRQDPPGPGGQAAVPAARRPPLRQR